MSSNHAAVDRARARAWLVVAVSSLLVAGLLAGGLVIARTPPLSHLVTDPAFFKRALVVHVDLAIVVWFYAFVAALFALVPSRVAATLPGRHAAAIAGVGVAMLLAAAGTDARPILANYVPVLESPLYVVGLVTIAVALACTFLDAKLLPGAESDRAAVPLPGAAIVGIRASGLIVLVALLTFATSRAAIPSGLSPEVHWELVMWGGGHVHQFASSAAMLAVWTMLVSRALGRPPIGRGAATILFALLVLPVLSAPVLAGMREHVGFTRLMQFGIAPVVVVYLAICLRSIVQARRDGTLAKDARAELAGFFASAGLAILGFVLGALIRGPNTMVPAHYHAAIGAVTVAFMAATVPLLRALGMPAPGPRRLRASAGQPALLGIGQAVYAAGFGLAGAHGMARKAYGAEQRIRTTAEWLGLGVMGLGGAIAIASGVLFLVIVVAMWRRRLSDSKTPLTRGDAWPLPADTRSNA